MRQQGWDLAAIDLGSLINDPTTHGGRAETNIRYTTALRALATIIGTFSSRRSLAVGEKRPVGAVGPPPQPAQR